MARTDVGGFYRLNQDYSWTWLAGGIGMARQLYSSYVGLGRREKAALAYFNSRHRLLSQVVVAPRPWRWIPAMLLAAPSWLALETYRTTSPLCRGRGRASGKPSTAD